MYEGDSFLIKPTVNGATKFKLLISDKNKLAMAAPVKISKHKSHSSAEIKLDQITNNSGLPEATAGKLGNAFANDKILTPPIRIKFCKDNNGDITTYKVFDMSTKKEVQIGPDQIYDHNNKKIFPLSGVIDKTSPGPNVPYTYDPGYTLTISNEPLDGDTFDITHNDGRFGNDWNARNMATLQNKKFIDGNSTYSSSYNSLVSKVGSAANEDEINLAAKDSLLEQSTELLQKAVGIDENEEYANLIRIQQSYQAAAQIIAVAKQVFETLLAAVI